MAPRERTRAAASAGAAAPELTLVSDSLVLIPRTAATHQSRYETQEPDVLRLEPARVRPLTSLLRDSSTPQLLVY